MTLYLSRLRIASNPSAQALRRMINPADDDARIDAHHKLLWSVFSDAPDRRRDFLWREMRQGEFLALSDRQPIANDLFDLVQSRPFAPDLAPSDRLSFSLKVNATRAKISGQRVDVVMDALHALPKEMRAERRMPLAQEAGEAWLRARAEANGFRVLKVEVEDYSTAALPDHRGPRKGRPQFGILSMTGGLEVTDPKVFIEALARGFGRAKAFGCGLMLIRRAA
jgi:CRISPR system Cascade subunit CasE